jgi:hypothetical protein
MRAASADSAVLVVTHGAAMRWALAHVEGALGPPIGNAVARKLVLEAGALRASNDAIKT